MRTLNTNYRTKTAICIRYEGIQVHHVSAATSQCPFFRRSQNRSQQSPGKLATQFCQHPQTLPALLKVVREDAIQVAPQLDGQKAILRVRFQRNDVFSNLHQEGLNIENGHK
ncbi:hypothetical protein L596_003711 [Steinernema carpocapsae]|uniref:Uncharacterized protein n=1 Tax=Steinernema carpocapsae TaxID=34508 RepID=A0A4U8UXG8_STECR|nr:hypothetical protein L596_003711 [Steinernema carpocapsae]